MKPMAGHTYFKVGGPADALAVPQNPEVLAALIRGAARRDLPFRVIGDGTNLLVTDAGIRGVVIALKAGFDAIRQAPATAGDIRVTAMAGAKLRALCRFAAGAGLAGMNFAAGIPGTVGGAMMMNAGTAEGTMAAAVTAVSVMDGQGEIRTMDKSRLSFGYRCMHWPAHACCGFARRDRSSSTAASGFAGPIRSG